MKSENELDDFLKAKEQEFHVPYKEEYWEKAAAYIDAERGGSVIARWSIGNIIILCSAIVLILGTASYFVFNSSSSDTRPKTQDTRLKTQDLRHKTQDNSTVTASAGSVNDNANKAENNNTSNDKTNVSSVPSVNNAAVNTGAKTKNTVTSATVANTVKHNKNVSIRGTASKANKASALSSNSTTAISQKNIKTHGKADRHENENADDNSTAKQMATANASADDLSAISPQQPPLPDYHIESLSSVFQYLSLSPKTQSEYEQLLKSEGSGAYTRVRELKNGTQYPMISVAVTGGVNIFNAFRESGKQYSYVSTNPFLGVNAIYQWNEKWFFQPELNALIRGGVNQNLPTIPASYKDEPGAVYRVKQLYYVQLPLMMGYQLSTKNAVTAGAGISYLAADGAQVRDSSGNNLGSYNLENRKGFNKIDVFLMAGYNYKVNKKISFSLTAAYGFIDVTQNSYFGENKYHNNMNLGLAINYQLLQRKAISR